MSRYQVHRYAETLFSLNKNKQEKSCLQTQMPCKPVRFSTIDQGGLKIEGFCIPRPIHTPVHTPCTCTCIPSPSSHWHRQSWSCCKPQHWEHRCAIYAWWDVVDLGLGFSSPVLEGPEFSLSFLKLSVGCSCRSLTRYWPFLLDSTVWHV